MLTGFYAFHTADTACFTFFSRKCALVFIGAENGGLCFVQGHHSNQRVGAGFDALLARAAGEGVDSRNAGADVDCVIRAGIHAVAVTYTAENALFRSAEKLFCHFA